MFMIPTPATCASAYETFRGVGVAGWALIPGPVLSHLILPVVARALSLDAWLGGGGGRGRPCPSA